MDAEQTTETDDTLRAIARAFDPAAFEDHPVEQRSFVAAVQWAARRKLATDAARTLLPWLARRDADLTAKVQAEQIERDAQIAEAAYGSSPTCCPTHRAQFEGQVYERERIAAAIREQAQPTPSSAARGTDVLATDEEVAAFPNEYTRATDRTKYEGQR